MTLFLERNKEDRGSQVEYRDDLNLDIVYQQKFGALGYGVFHPKLILYEFDD